MENTYKYLFPFEKIPKNSNVLIYGAGLLGQEYLKQIEITKYCNIIGFADKNFRDCKSPILPVYSPNDIGKLNFDYVVIALRGGFSVPAVKKVLHEQCVSDDKIVCVLERIAPHNYELTKSNNVAGLSMENLHDRKITFAIYMSGGIGDMIAYKRFVEELHRLVPTSIMDIFTVRHVGFAKWLYTDDSYVTSIVSDLDGHYTDKKWNYSLSLTINGCGLLEVDVFNEAQFSTDYTDFSDKIKELKKQLDYEALSVSMPAALMFYRRICRGENFYTGFNYGGIFSIKDNHVHIPMLKKYEQEYINLNLTNYITFNIENGTDNNRESVAKTWPLDYFIDVIQLIKKSYPNIAVVQLGTPNGTLIENADMHIMGREFGLVAQVLKNAIFHFDTEGGLVHLASQLNTKCLVLFGQTPMKYFAYDQNINITVGDCHGCSGLYGDAGVCAKGQKKPECMYKITPKIAMSYIDKYLRDVYC